MVGGVITSKKDRGSSRDDDRSIVKAGNYQIAFWSISSVLGLLILLQSLREFFASVYYYNLIELSISPVTGLLVIFLIPILTGRIVKVLGIRGAYMISGAVMAGCRIPMGMGLNTPMHLIFATITLSASMVFLSMMLSIHKRERKLDPETFSSQSLVAFFGITYLMTLFLLALGHGVDASTVTDATGVVLSPALSMLISGFLGFTLFLQRRSLLLDDERGGHCSPGSLFTGGIADSWAPAWGIGGSIFVLFAVVSNPSVIVGWIGTDFGWAVSSSMAALSIFLLSLLSSSGTLLALRSTFSNPKGAVIGNLVMLLAAANLFYFNQPFPFAPAVIVWIAMVDTWVILDAATDHRPFAGESFEITSSAGRKVVGYPHRSKSRQFPGHFGKAVSLSMGFFAIMAALLTISLNWSFVPLGFFLKGAVPSLMFAGFVVLALAGFSCSKYKIEEPWIRLGNDGLRIEKGSPAMAAGKGSGTASRAGRVSRRLRSQWLTLGAITVSLIILTGGTSIINYIEQPREKELEDDLVVATYNIHHGFSNEGRIDPGRHLDLLESIDPDIVFLQESDSLLFSEGNFDPAFFIASRIDMFLFRGPNPGTGSPGVAILSRFPMKDIEVHYLPSTAIQRIALSCIVTLDDKDVRLIGLHMGLEEEERSGQIDEIVEIVSGFDEEVIMGGDFNTEPREDMMRKINNDLFGTGNSSGNISLGLGSVWHSSPDRGGRALDTPTYPAPDVDDEEAHIDYVFFSDGFDVKKACINDGIGVSDHRLVWGELEIIF